MLWLFIITLVAVIIFAWGSARLEQIDPVFRRVVCAGSGGLAMMLGLTAGLMLSLGAVEVCPATMLLAQESTAEASQESDAQEKTTGEAADEELTEDLETLNDVAESAGAEADTAEESKVDSEAADSEAADSETADRDVEIQDIQIGSTPVIVNEEQRPEWVEQPKQTTGAVHQIAVTAGPYQRLQKCREELRVELKKALDEYVDDQLEHPGASGYLAFSPAFIQSRLVTTDDTYQEQIVSPTVGQMHQIHALIRIDDGFRDQMYAEWQAVVQRQRLLGLSIVSVGAILLISVLFSYFRLDTASRGFYTRRLQFLTAVAILALFAAGGWILQSINWL